MLIDNRHSSDLKRFIIDIDTERSVKRLPAWSLIKILCCPIFMQHGCAPALIAAVALL